MKVVVEVVVLATVEWILVVASVAVEGSISPLSLTDTLSRDLVRDVAGEEAPETSPLVLREVVATPPACFCKILRLSSWAVCSTPTKLFTCSLLSRAAPLAGIPLKAISAALAPGHAPPDTFISTTPFIIVLAAVEGSALSSEEEENQEETFFDQIHPFCDCDSSSW